MKMRMSNNKDFFAGLMFFLFGVFAMIVARNYPMGTSFRMGPGYFPTVLGGGLALLGLITAVRAVWLNSEPIEPCALRPLLLTFSSILAFGIILDPFGLVLAVLTLVWLGCLGGQEFRLWEVTILGIVLTALVLGIFVYGLGLTFKVWPV
jgi:hypothetical protein